MKIWRMALTGLAFAIGFAVYGGSQGRISQAAETEEANTSNILIAYDAPGADTPAAEAAALLKEETNGRLLRIGEADEENISSFEYVFLGFEAEKNALPEEVEAFLEENDFGARTIFPFVAGEDNDAEEILQAISQLQPGALLGDALMLSSEVTEQEIGEWVQELGVQEEETLPEAGGDTVASAVVTPLRQQVLYLWEEGNAPEVTEYTENNGSYFDDPDFRPYITSYPVPEGTEIKGAVLICPGGAFQFRSDQPEGVDVAEALSALGYQSFVVDYRLRPYTQQEGALDLARAVRFVRAHAQEYGIEEEDIAVMGFSAGGILSGEMLLNFDGEVNGTVLDADYVPDELDQVSADAAEEAGVSVERLQLEDMPHGFGAEGGWIPDYDEWLSGIFS